MRRKSRSKLGHEKSIVYSNNTVQITHDKQQASKYDLAPFFRCVARLLPAVWMRPDRVLMFVALFQDLIAVWVVDYLGGGRHLSLEELDGVAIEPSVVSLLVEK